MISFKYGLILFRFSSIDSVIFLSPLIVTPKITYSYRFVIIFFCFMLKKVPNISNYSVFGCFTFFKSKKNSYTFNCSVIYFCFQSKKISYIFNYVVFYFLCFSNFQFSIIMRCEKTYLIFLLLEKAFENTIFKVFQVVLSETKIF